MPRPAYEYRHVVGFAETNLVGNVYYTHHLEWQGRCREFFLRDRAPGLLAELRDGLKLVTTRCSCEYLAELVAFDDICVRMRLAELTQNRLSMNFEYWRVNQGQAEKLVARGEQQVACMRNEGGATVPAPFPPAMRAALEPYMQA